MESRNRQAGITLVVSLIMLIVLTLLVVSAIRFGNINLKIAGNAQTQAEAEAATQVALEQTVELMKAATKVDSVTAQPALQISTGGATYKINVSKPSCTLSNNVVSTQLNKDKAEDRACYGNIDQECIFDKDGKCIPQPTECKDQTWEISAAVTADTAGNSMTMVQGVSLRVSSEVACP
ncbi:pilus assembly PilX family protein [Ramlibacter sp. PS4R-6]|uniref:pilus assembly PilX family protein n=1 Tax=Ramlibacter sp. PS4R-6 TaxID=3133438 RepID=UPI0030ABB67C